MKFVNDGRDILGEVCGQYAPQPPQRLFAGKFSSVEALTAAFEELERQDAALDETLRAQNMNEIFWGRR